MTGILDMTLKGLGEMSEGYSAEICARKIPLVPMGVLAKPILTVKWQKVVHFCDWDPG